MAGFRHLDPLWVVAAGGNIQVESCTSLPLFWQNILLIQQTALLFSIGDVNKWHISILWICCRNLMPFTFKCFLPIYLHLILWNSPVWNFKFDELYAFFSLNWIQNREHSHMTSDVFWVFLTYLPTLITIRYFTA